MVTMLFVHGTGVRQEAYDEALKAIGDQLKGDLAPRVEALRIRLEGCFWGEELGAQLYADGASVPTFDATRAVEAGEAPDSDPRDDLWVLLSVDPLAELRMLALVRAGKPPLGEHKGYDLADDLTRFNATPVDQLPAELQDKIQALDLAPVFHEARQAVAASPECKGALAGAADSIDGYPAALARAIVAKAAALRWAGGFAPSSLPDDRDRLVDSLTGTLGGGDRSVVDRVRKQITGLAGAVAASVGTFGASRYRGRITDAAARIVGDILIYQTKRGEQIRRKIAEAVKDCDGPVILVAHSLGGIAAVELLIEDPSLTQVELLVTLGSQSPFLYEIGALERLKYRTPLPPHFPAHWLNFYDLNDFLSYVGQNDRVFGSRIRDVQMFSRKSFPDAHSHYFRDPKVWVRVLEEWKAILAGKAATGNVRRGVPESAPGPGPMPGDAS